MKKSYLLVAVAAIVGAILLLLSLNHLKMKEENRLLKDNVQIHKEYLKQYSTQYEMLYDGSFNGVYDILEKVISEESENLKKSLVQISNDKQELIFEEIRKRMNDDINTEMLFGVEEKDSSILIYKHNRFSAEKLEVNFIIESNDRIDIYTNLSIPQRGKSRRTEARLLNRHIIIIRIPSSIDGEKSINIIEYNN